MPQRLRATPDATLRKQRYERESTETATFERLHAILAERLPAGERTRRLAAGACLAAEAAIAFALRDRDV